MVSIEKFRCVVDVIEDACLQLSTVSSEGEEGIAWMPIDKLSEEDQSNIIVGSLIDISINKSGDVTTHTIKVEKPRKLTPEVLQLLSKVIKEKMQGVLSGYSSNNR